MNENIRKLESMDPFFKGLVMILCGAILLLHTLGILERGFSLLIVAISLYLIVQGLMLTGLYQRFENIMKRP